MVLKFLLPLTVAVLFGPGISGCSRRRHVAANPPKPGWVRWELRFEHGPSILAYLPQGWQPEKLLAPGVGASIDFHDKPGGKITLGYDEHADKDEIDTFLRSMPNKKNQLIEVTSSTVTAGPWKGNLVVSDILMTLPVHDRHISCGLTNGVAVKTCGYSVRSGEFRLSPDDIRAITGSIEPF